MIYSIIKLHNSRMSKNTNNVVKKLPHNTTGKGVKASPETEPNKNESITNSKTEEESGDEYDEYDNNYRDDDYDDMYDCEYEDENDY